MGGHCHLLDFGWVGLVNKFCLGYAVCSLEFHVGAARLARLASSVYYGLQCLYMA